MMETRYQTPPVAALLALVVMALQTMGASPAIARAEADYPLSQSPSGNVQ
jgi:hypothetical protein